MPGMKYVSTRGDAPALEFADVTLTGLAADGGLYVPEEWPLLDADAIRALRGLDYVETAVRVMQPFVGSDLTEADLRNLCRAAYAGFSHASVTPLRQLDADQWLLELFHGPTLAFKDVALQLLGRLFERFLSGAGRQLTVVGATSGDTGSAAIHALAGLESVDVFMMHPRGRISDVQRRQMTTVMAPNVHNMAINGSFDDAQAHVKRMFRDPELRGFEISAVNSINWARLMAQVVYYFYAAVRLGAPERKIAFSVPTGNFGDVFAGYVAHRMGLPVERLIVATNVNDILHRALSAGDYSAGAVTPTASPSMDIQVSSNFERLLFEMAGRDGARVRAMMDSFDSERRLSLPADMRARAALFSSARIDADHMALALRWAREDADMLIDPHTAIGLAAARAASGSEDLPAGTPIVTLATAHPAKFAEAVERAAGERPRMPERIAGLMDREERFHELAADYETARDFVASRARPRAAHAATR